MIDLSKAKILKAKMAFMPITRSLCIHEKPYHRIHIYICHATHSASRYGKNNQKSTPSVKSEAYLNRSPE